MLPNWQAEDAIIRRELEPVDGGVMRGDCLLRNRELLKFIRVEDFLRLYVWSAIALSNEKIGSYDCCRIGTRPRLLQSLQRLVAMLA